jgi:VWFA-related protein
MKRVAVLFVFAVFLITAVRVSAQETDIIKVETNLVSVPVIVSDRQGRYISNLKLEDFKIYMDSEEQKIEFFGTSEEPLNIALVIDTSHSTREVIEDIKQTAIAFINFLRPKDRVMVVTFDKSVNLLTPLTGNRFELESGIRQAEIGRRPGTVLRDGIREVVEQSFRNIQGRKAMILLTDGADFFSKTTKEELINIIEESDTLIYPVFFDSWMAISLRNTRVRERRKRPGDIRPRQDGNPPRINAGVRRRQSQAVRYLKQIAGMTAGRYYNSSIDDLEETFEKITEELRKQYRLGFYPLEEKVGNGTLHRLRVKVSRQSISARARRGFRSK